MPDCTRDKLPACVVDCAALNASVETSPSQNSLFRESNSDYASILGNLRQLYIEDPRPWLVGFSGGKDSTMVAALIFEAVAGIPAADRRKSISILCTDTRVEIPAIVEMIEGTLERMRKFARKEELNVEVHLLKPPTDQSFWVNIIGRGYPPPNRHFRWCTQRMKIDPVNVFVERRLGRTGEAILHLGARRAESATRGQTMAGREAKNGLHRHPDLPRVDVCNPIEYLTTEEVWLICCNTIPRGEVRTATSTGSTRTPAAANVRSISIPAPRAAETPASAAGPAPSSSATKPAKASSPVAMSAWNRYSAFARPYSTFRIRKTAGATPAG